jgi:hypothetical protein
LLTALALLACAAAAPAQGVLDLIPEDAAAGVGIRSLNDLKKKGDKLIADAQLDLPLRPSQALEQLYGLLNVGGAVDEDAPAAVVLANPAKAGGKKLTEDFLDLLVLALPFTDRDKIAARFTLKGEDLKPDKVVPGKLPTFGLDGVFCAHGKHLLIARNPKALLSVLQGRAAGKSLGDGQRRALAGADLLVYFSPPSSWGDEWNEFLKYLTERLTADAGAGERTLVEQLVATLKTVRSVVGGLRVDGGVGLTLLAAFPEKGNEAARKFLTALQAGPGASDLAGLPEGPAVFAQASKGSGARNALIMKLLAECLLRDVFQAPWLPGAADRANIVGAFAEVWKHLKGERVAVYQNADEPRLGLFSAVAVLDTEDGEKFLAAMKALARLASGEGLGGAGGQPRQEDVAEVRRLIRNLGDDDYTVRESASIKLALIGEPALPYLEKALDSDDAEVRRRAEELKAKIVAAAASRRKELLAKDVPWRIRPSFVFCGAETRHGQRVETVRVLLKEKDAPAAGALRQLLGPDWDKVRLVAQGKQVVVLLGSDERLLFAALKNLKEGRPGLAGSKALAPFARYADAARKVEIHASLGTVLALMRAEDLKEGRPAPGGPSLTSFALTVAPERLQLDVWVPATEIKAVAKEQGW